MVIVSVHQPNFMPWLKLMAKVLGSDVYVAYDSVQFTRQEFHARQLLKSRAGTQEWLTVPVMSTGTRQILNNVRVAENGWPKPAGWTRRIAAPNASTSSGGADAANMVGKRASTNLSEASSDNARACCRRCWAASRGSEPAHPA
ncbi:WbqC family protein [Arthrobacter sp. MMS18-M83]|nr:WbqC family protein [Arthrobacter sp. MMS18-M83]WAH98130.1 WbqC family protein [Arthrobacter sp. MMS18-M83]